jgi:hypothetical protein
MFFYWRATMATMSPIFESDLIFEQYVEETHFRGFSIGYELEEFRYETLVELIFSALLDFSLPDSEKQSISIVNAQRKMRNAARAVYASDK